MKYTSPLIFILVLFLACKPDKAEEQSNAQASSENDITFDQTKWMLKEDGAYPFREQMFRDVLYNDTIRSLSKSEIIDLLGTPDREQDNHLYYEISRSGLGAVTLHARTMVVKIKSDDAIEWIKVHE